MAGAGSSWPWLKPQGPCHAGVPAPNRNFFCDPASSLCFNVSTAFLSFDQASAACEAMTGLLVQHTTAAKQLMVEQVRG
jgi:hypothetical protein